MSVDLNQYLLPSGRGVRVKELSPSAKDIVTKKAAKLSGKDASIVDFRMCELHEGVVAMLKEVTVNRDCKTVEDLLSKEVKWKDVNYSDLDEKYDEYFSSKDDTVLSNIYRKLHEVTFDELESISLKVQTVTRD